jgi:hypothetical protein
MANFYIREYSSIVQPGPEAHGSQVPQEPGVDQPVLPIGGHAESAPFADTTRMVRLHCDAICSFLVGSAPVATSANARMAANQTEYIGVTPGSKLKVSVVTNV